MTSESRVLPLPPETVARLYALGVEQIDDAQAQSIRQLLPSQLNAQEVEDIGLSVNNHAERQEPSRDGISHGHTAETRSLIGVAVASLMIGDTVTAESVLGHFKSRKLGLINSLAGYGAVWLTYRRARRSQREPDTGA